ncbi:phosphopantetheine-binding protein [Streptomyces boluensis]|uniref:Carrier domain-containing protein n=1 Tax=Streptomyces boluensis TaxID=1775135 RepID=A0A964XJD1_9ACTN|nr:phosphopantetheine-binding protein [Streptomyces boluensis]NBE51174.1 hypothetical protein [Streptomyces boluensis]
MESEVEAVAARVVGIVGEVLGERDVPVGEHFQDLGGSSLQAIRICARVRKELGVKAAPEALFESDTVGEFSAALARAVDRA